MERLNKQEGKKRVYSSWITGCCLFFNRSLLNDLSKIEQPKRNGMLFCEDFPWGMGEDTDLDYYITHRLNKKLGVARDVFVWHHGQKTLEECPVDWREIQHQNDNILRKRWPEIFPNG